MSKVISTIKFDDTLSLTECTDGFWLYDKSRGMNLSMRAKTKDDAFFESLKYYQTRLSSIEKSYYGLKSRVELFAESIIGDE